jgi:hypothetical protein
MIIKAQVLNRECSTLTPYSMEIRLIHRGLDVYQGFATNSWQLSKTSSPVDQGFTTRTVEVLMWEFLELLPVLVRILDGSTFGCNVGSSLWDLIELLLLLGSFHLIDGYIRNFPRFSEVYTGQVTPGSHMLGMR